MNTTNPTQSPSPSKGSGSWKKYLIGFVLILLIPVFGFWFYNHHHFVWTNDAYLDGYQISISSDINARIITLYVDEGDIVQKGKLLCQLDESIYNSQKLDAETTVQLLAQQIELKAIQIEKLRDIYTVALNEYENEIISFIDFDKIEKDFLLAEADYRIAVASHTNGIAKLGVIQELLRHTKVYAPRDGAIAKRWVVAGDAVQFGQPLFVLTDTQNIWVTANFEETKVENVSPGDSVKVHIDAYPGMTFEGSVFVVRASAASQFAFIPPNNATGNFTKVVQRVPVKILLKIPKSKTPLYLYPGMSVEVDIKIR
jgi:membrane fusion protein (multidrug efflux system)